MAALCAGSYGLSQQQQQYPNNDNKELIFVKLTDSALRAIEEFQRNQVSDWVFSNALLYSSHQNYYQRNDH